MKSFVCMEQAAGTPECSTGGMIRCRLLGPFLSSRSLLCRCKRNKIVLVHCPEDDPSISGGVNHNLLTMFLSHFGRGFASLPAPDPDDDDCAAPACACCGPSKLAGAGTGSALPLSSARNGAGKPFPFITASSHFKLTTALGISPNSLSVLPFTFLSPNLYSTFGGAV